MEKKVCEDFFNLAINPNSGHYRVSGNYLSFGVLGAILMDLALSEKIKLNEKKISVNMGAITGLTVFDKALETLSSGTKERTIRHWLRRLSFKAHWYRRELQKLHLQNGILKKERKRFLGIPYSVYFPSDPSRLIRLTMRLTDIILYNKEANEQEVMLLGLVYACRMHRSLAKTSTERRSIRKALVRYIKDNPYASGVSNTIAEMQAAITASITAAVIASSSSASTS